MVHIWNTFVLTNIVDISCTIVLYGTELVGIYTIEWRSERTIVPSGSVYRT